MRSPVASETLDGLLAARRPAAAAGLGGGHRPVAGARRRGVVAVVAGRLSGVRRPGPGPSRRPSASWPRRRVGARRRRRRRLRVSAIRVRPSRRPRAGDGRRLRHRPRGRRRRRGARARRVRAGPTASPPGVDPADAVPLPGRRRALAVGGLLGGGRPSRLAWSPNHQDDVRRRQRGRAGGHRRRRPSGCRRQADELAEEPERRKAEQALAEQLDALADELEPTPRRSRRPRRPWTGPRPSWPPRCRAGLESQRAAAQGLDRRWPPTRCRAPAASARPSSWRRRPRQLGELEPQPSRRPWPSSSRRWPTARRSRTRRWPTALAEAAGGLGRAMSPARPAALGEAAAAAAARPRRRAAQDAAGDGRRAPRSADAARPASATPASATGEGDGRRGPGSQATGQGRRRRARVRATVRARARAAGGARARVRVRRRDPSGQVGGTSAPTGQGQGGVGTPNGSGDNPRSARPELGDEATVYDPAGDSSTPGAGRRATIPARPSARATPRRARRGPRAVADVLAATSAEATRALERADVPPSLRALVRAYFDAW